MPTIFIKDDLRAAVEAASGGRQTVLYTAKGQPSYMNVVPKFMLEDVADAPGSLGTGVHPAFIVNGIEKTEFFYGAYAGVIKNGELLSLPNVNPARSSGFDTFSTAARASGAGWHMGTNAEWAALMLWCHKNGFVPRGNSNYGGSSDAAFETGRRVDGGAPGLVTGDPVVLTGSGPASWRHDNTPNGISDLNANLWEWQGGMRLMDGEIQIIPNNDAASADLSSTSAAWKAIRLTDGALVAPGTAGTAKFDSPTDTTVGNGGSPVLSSTIINRNGPIGDNGTFGVMTAPFNGMTTAAGVTAPAILLALGLFRHKDVADSDLIYLRNYGERLLFRGGGFGSGSAAGLRSVTLQNPRAYAGGSFGARPAFVL
ncbi:hypothetical protein [Pseudomonas vancouverensis]|uniref:Sulfatase-modifying factor enzyme domain-containing protein n=1 Tax=Pseudomonas vancouverensis TaxID=95300 RepID=A0A1H2NAB0_PSEVA|nr:hypothetical protein [Pseudomonas vancouverensis]KAB0494021.1 hypothetical protein F7R09_19790 [Pseudomonas vancouverensis]TDB61458.1 hypothetical protein EIY72_15440 [Pseudomonas vancouverensis]SDV01746.1 hypothetical protein SAMN05216558_1869 [Pseudomonas vancouverensis]